MAIVPLAVERVGHVGHVGHVDHIVELVGHLGHLIDRVCFEVPTGTGHRLVGTKGSI